MFSETWRSAIIQGAMVLLGVLLALFVDEWREDREFQQLVVTTEAQVLEEITTNRAQLQIYLDEFVSRSERLNDWIAELDFEQSILDQLEGFPGIPSTFTNKSAWTMANNSQLTEYIDHEFYDAAFHLYESGDSLAARYDAALALLVDVKAADATYTQNLSRVLVLYYDDFIGNLNSLIRRHDLFVSEQSADRVAGD